MRKIYIILFALMLACVGCEWQLRPDGEVDVKVDRYDRIQSLYLTTSDFSALQQMNTVYPMQTRTLIEDVLHIGRVNDPQISTRFLRFYQDSTLQALISESEQQYASMDDLNEELTRAFKYLKKQMPALEVPEVYAQIGSLDQSIIVGNGQIGICLDKYLGAEYELYLRPEYGYTLEQRQMMERQYIVPDCVGFFLLSLYPTDFERITQEERDRHIGKIQWVVNKALGRQVFQNDRIREVERYMKNHKDITLDQLLSRRDLRDLR